MRRILLTVLLLLLGLAASVPASAESISYLSVPAVLRPGKLYDIIINSPRNDVLSLALIDASGEVVYEIFNDFPIVPGENHMTWDGIRTDYTVVEQGEYVLQLKTETDRIITPLRIGIPYPLITHVLQDTDILTGADAPMEVSFDTSEAGTVVVTLRDEAGKTTPLRSFPASAGANSYRWDGTVDGNRVADGQYSLILLLRLENGMESTPHYVSMQVGQPAPPVEEASIVVEDNSAEEETPDAEATTTEETTAALVETTTNTEETTAPPETGTETAAVEAEATAAPATGGQPSPAYSSIDDGSYWSMTPGETDDAKIWEILMQPITVYDGGIDQKDHVYLMENEDGSGKKVAQAHAQSQGLHVIGEPNSHGYVLVETFSAYDNSDFKPRTAEDKEHALELKQGYVKASGLKTVQVQTDYALVIDKKTQRLYIYHNGERVSELLISTGKLINEEYYRETPPGEFITVSHVGPFSTNKYMKSDMAIRISGGILIHEVPYEPLGDGTRRYSEYEAKLGTKASAGCIRVQRQKNEDGYNQTWIWDTFKNAAPYKVIIWDDVGRTDSPTTKYPNPS